MKKGFTKNVSLAREKWAGFIKDYDGGTLMECRINETLDYLHLPTVIRQQREVLFYFILFYLLFIIYYLLFIIYYFNLLFI